MGSSLDPFMPYSDKGPIRGTFKNNKSQEWIENSFEFQKQTGKQVPISYTKRHIGGSFSKKHYYYTASSFTLLLFFLLLRVFSLQIVEGKNYADRADNNRVRNLPIIAERGTIMDRFGIALTKNVPNFSLAITPQDLPRDTEGREKIVKKLAEITDQEETFIREQLKIYGGYSYESIVIAEDLDYETAISIQIEAGSLPGVNIQRGSKRFYIHPGSIKEENFTSLSHVLGYNGKLSPDELKERYKKGYLPSDSIGKAGIEKQYEEALRGTYGKKQIEVNARGREQLILSQESPEPGKHIKLTIDAQAQFELEKILKKHLAKKGLSNAAAIAINPQNGEIISLVSLPAYDNNDFSGGIDQKTYNKYITDDNRPLFNRTVGGIYPSGSTIKLVVALAGLQEGVITPATKILSNGGIRVSQWFFPDWQDGGHGLTDVRSSLANSVNTFYYYIGGGYQDFEGLGVDKIVKYLKLFGLGDYTGIDLPGERRGFVPSKAWKQEKKNERWYIGDTYNLSIGQGDLLVTPLQIASITAAVANEGQTFKPKLKYSEIDVKTNKETITKKEVLKKDLVDKEYVSVAKEGMRDCVTLGSCRRLSLLSFSAGGKTGTAQWNSKAEPHAWFTSFAPYENPQIVVTILVEEGEGGSLTAAPIAYEFLRWWGKYRL